MSELTTCVILLPKILDYAYTGEFRAVRNGEYFLYGTAAIGYKLNQWSGDEASVCEYFIMKPKVDLSSYYMTIQASNIYTDADIEAIPDEYEIIDFRYPRFEEHYLYEGRVLKRSGTKQLHLPSLILKKKEENNA